MGLLFVYLAAFTYETTDARIRNTLEDLWLKLEYGPRTPAGIAQRLARVVLSLMDGIFDRVFGGSLLSIRTLAVASCYAYGAIALSWSVVSFLAFVAEVSVDEVIANSPLTARGIMIVGIAAILIGTLPAIRAWLRWVTYFATVVIVAGLLAAVWAVMTGRALPVTEPEDRLMASLASLIALLYGIAVIHAIRFGIRKITTRELTRRGRLVIGGLLTIAIVAFAALLSLALIVREPRGQLTVWVSNLLSQKAVFDVLFPLGGVVAPWGAALVIGLLLSFVVLMHLALWPALRFVLMKTLYAAQRHDLINQKTTLRTIGFGLVVGAMTPTDFMTKIIEALR
jgi:hypothetical protein